MTTIFTVMSALAQQYGAINLSQGFPDFPIDERLGELVYKAIREGYNQYAPMAGLPALREAIAVDLKQRYGFSVDPVAEITVTPGATYAIYTAFKTVLKPGDEAIVLEPAYDSYQPNIRECGATPIRIPLVAPSFSPDWDRIKAAITPRTKAIIVNTPHNPTGTIWAKEDWDMLAETIRDTDITVLSDEVYEQLVYDGKHHHSVLQHEELRQRAFALFSFGKVHHNTGWKTGYCIAPPHLTDRFRLLHQYLAFSVNTPVQKALADFLPLPQTETAASFLQKKRDYFLELLKETPFTIQAPAAGSYFQLAGYERISNLPDRDFAEWLTKEHGVAVIPVSAFYTSPPENGLIRFCFAKKEETQEKAVERIRGIKK